MGAMLIAKVYDDIGYPLDPDNMTWPVIKQFLEQWKALMERRKQIMAHPQARKDPSSQQVG